MQPSTKFPQKASRPNFPTWTSHSSHFLKQGKPVKSSPPTQIKSAAQIPSADLDDCQKQLSLKAPKKPSKRSIKRWLWRGPMTSSDAHSIADVINSPELAAVHPELGIELGPPNVASPPPLPSPSQKHPRFGSRHRNSSGKEAPVLSPLIMKPSDLSEAALFSPDPHGDRREASSYFGIDDNSETAGNPKHYNADYIGTALGGISPEPSPPRLHSPVPKHTRDRESHSTSKTPLTPEHERELPARMLSTRQGTARSRSMPMEFVPPGLTRVNTPPDFSAANTGKASGFFFEGPSPEDGQDQGMKKRPRTASRYRTARGGTSSSGFWDSDAVLMSQMNVSDEDVWNDPKPLVPPETPDPETDWFRVRMDQIMTEDPPNFERNAGGSDDGDGGGPVKIDEDGTYLRGIGSEQMS
ncbi:hypothetical protein MPH_05466 [Macrophomina phaseolina MS6]|uniref:Uncharacterized protein n=1 Tax=Macrophomina phaseolina (strain MS6) TaxID=1126212 RepID=K2RRR0_MACPH|nr:hypothetical protein MPH_05466 [Macrophomina phaseolina MS6]